MSQGVSQEALIRLLIEKGMFTEEEFWEGGESSGPRDEKEKEMIEKARFLPVLVKIHISHCVHDCNRKSRNLSDKKAGFSLILP